jgi:hypothetical protein
LERHYSTLPRRNTSRLARCSRFDTNMRCLSVRYSRVLGGTIDFSSRTPLRERKSETGWRRGLDSNSWLRFAADSPFIGRQNAYFALSAATESPNRRIGQNPRCASQARLFSLGDVLLEIFDLPPKTHEYRLRGSQSLGRKMRSSGARTALIVWRRCGNCASGTDAAAYVALSLRSDGCVHV